ncbi:MAG: 4-(cytidine 5'-diphospho)-2-C-methyl-D-erythritol kinase [Desulfovermiculus sp.]|nr:4-(cytidine 5'-diphospho)-2-C-methyl-D-erythritol kinase [Desulfovermiculus sp.]
MSPPTILETGCKANLYLRILGRRDDGYHRLQSLFVPLARPSDRLTIGNTPNPGLELTCTYPELSGEDNILHRAYAAFACQTGWRPGISVHLEKNIPHGAGLGGGSADAAALFKHLNAICPQDNSLTQAKLLQVAQEIGADVPFFLSNTPAWVQGIGERIRPVRMAYASGWLVVVCPDVQISTAEAYKAWDRAEARARTGQGRAGTDPKYPNPLCSRGQILWNDFESVLFPIYPELIRLKTKLLRCGAQGAVLSGSGGSMVGLFSTYHGAGQAADELQDNTTRVFINSIPTCW